MRKVAANRARLRSYQIGITGRDARFSCVFKLASVRYM